MAAKKAKKTVSKAQAKLEAKVRGGGRKPKAEPEVKAKKRKAKVEDEPVKRGRGRPANPDGAPVYWKTLLRLPAGTEGRIKEVVEAYRADDQKVSINAIIANAVEEWLTAQGY